MHLFLFLALATEPIPAEELVYTAGPVQVTGRYKGFFDNKLTLYDTEISFLITGSDHISFLLGLEKKKDTIQITGSFVDTETIKVSNITKAPNDVELARTRSQRHEPGSAEFYEIAKEARKKALRFEDAELKTLASILLEQYFTQKAKTISMKESDKNLAWADEVLQHTGNKQMVINRFNVVLKSHPEQQPIISYLSALNCVEWRRQWYTEERFMELQQYSQINGTWVTREELLFIQACAQIRASLTEHPIIRLKTDASYELEAKKGNLCAGMNRKEAVKAWGFADKVNRRTENGQTFEQWRYENSYIYLMNDVVVLVPPDE